MRSVEQQLEEMRADLRAIQARLPPEGWEDVGCFSFSDDPTYTLSLNIHTRRWSVWRVGNNVPLLEASTSQEAAALFAARRVRA